MRALSSYSLITLEEPDLENISRRYMLILGLLRNILIVNDKYPVKDCENLSFQIQMILSLKPKTFSHLFIPSLEST